MSYEYKIVKIVRVVDGDTVDLVIDLGFHLTSTLRFRLIGVDTPERGNPGWAEATLYVSDWLSNPSGVLWAVTTKADSFGRWLVSIEDRTTLTTHVLNDGLVDSGHAVIYKR